MKKIVFEGKAFVSCRYHYTRSSIMNASEAEPVDEFVSRNRTASRYPSLLPLPNINIPVIRRELHFRPAAVDEAVDGLFHF